MHIKGPTTIFNSNDNVSEHDIHNLCGNKLERTITLMAITVTSKGQQKQEKLCTLLIQIIQILTINPHMVG